MILKIVTKENVEYLGDFVRVNVHNKNYKSLVDYKKENKLGYVVDFFGDNDGCMISVLNCFYKNGSVQKVITDGYYEILNGDLQIISRSEKIMQLN